MIAVWIALVWGLVLALFVAFMARRQYRPHVAPPVEDGASVREDAA